MGPRIISTSLRLAAGACLLPIFIGIGCQQPVTTVGETPIETPSGEAMARLTEVKAPPSADSPESASSKPATGESRVNTPADLIVKDAKVWTGDVEKPAAEAFAIRAGEIVALGREVDVAAFRGPNTSILDAHGRRVVPGLIDAHLHLISGGQQLGRLNLRDAKDRKEFVQFVRAYAESRRPGEWLLGGRWTTESWADPEQPTRQWIDVATGETPALLDRMDGHGALANSAALKLAGIDAKGPADPAGGRIERDPATNEPTGILKEGAIDLVRKHVPPASAAELRAALAASMREANRFGITAVHTMSPWSDMAVLDAARADKDLSLRVRVYVMEDDWTAFVDRAKQHRADDWVRIAGFKQFADGSLGSRTSYMTEPFADTPGNRGLPQEILNPAARLLKMCTAVRTAYFGCAVHAIGDAANHEVLGVYEQVPSTLVGVCSTGIGLRERAAPTYRIEHAQHLLPGDIARFAKLGVVASMQPLHKADDGRYAAAAIGRDRCKSSYAFRSLLDAGATLAFGSDFPVVTLDPFKGMHAAITGNTLDGKVFVPEQNIKVEEALAAYTRGAAAAAGDTGRLGVIRVGAMADFAVLNDDILSMKPDEISNTWVAYTYVGGRQVWPGAGDERK